jgi:hypothetical protein
MLAHPLESPIELRTHERFRIAATRHQHVNKFLRSCWNSWSGSRLRVVGFQHSLDATNT